MQIAENWASVAGRVVRLAPREDIEGFTDVDLEVDEIGPIEGMPNLFDVAPGQRILVSFPTHLVEERAIVPGASIRSRIRLGGSGAIYVDPEDIEVTAEP
jgi:hypothetical protein